MSKHGKKDKSASQAKPKRRDGAKAPKAVIPNDASLRVRYDEACRLAETGRQEEARPIYETLVKAVNDASLKALVTNDLGTLAFLSGDCDAARASFQTALALNQNCEPARTNLGFLDELGTGEQEPDGSQLSTGDLRSGPVRGPETRAQLRSNIQIRLGALAYLSRQARASLSRCVVLCWINMSLSKALYAGINPL